MRNPLALILFGLLISLHVTAYAQTPDGETPALEDICDGLEGAAYGLCNAYCEAMDCDGTEPQASEIACEKVLANYEEITNGSIPPCFIECGLPGLPPCPLGEFCSRGMCFPEPG